MYKVPPRTTTEGYRAAAWNDQGLLWKGRLRVMEVGGRCEIRLEVGLGDGGRAGGRADMQAGGRDRTPRRVGTEWLLLWFQ